MPQLVICHKCGAVLYEGEELKPLEEIIPTYDGKCPNCGKKLSDVPQNFEVRPVEVARTDVTDSVRKQELKSRKRVYSQKRKKKRKSNQIYVTDFWPF